MYTLSSLLGVVTGATEHGHHSYWVYVIICYMSSVISEIPPLNCAYELALSVLGGHNQDLILANLAPRAFSNANSSVKLYLGLVVLRMNEC